MLHFYEIKMAFKLKIDKKYYLMEQELKAITKPDDSNLVNVTKFFFKEIYNSNYDVSLLCHFKKKLPFDIIDFSPLYTNLHMNQMLV